MKIKFRCPECYKRFKIDETMAGKKAKCVCGAILTTPSSSLPEVKSCAKPTLSETETDQNEQPQDKPEKSETTNSLTYFYGTLVVIAVILGLLFLIGQYPCIGYLLIPLAVIVFFVFIQWSIEADKHRVKAEGWSKRQEERRKLREAYDIEISALLKQHNIQPVYKLIRSCYQNRMSIVVGKDKICFLSKGGNCITANAYAFSDILAVEILTEHAILTESTITKDGPAKIGRAVVGGLIAGPTGAIVGGLSGKRNGNSQSVSRKKIKSISLLITVRDMKNPLFTIPFDDLSFAKKWESRLNVALSDGKSNTP